MSDVAEPSSVLGVSAFYHDSAAALLSGGELVGACEEERFSRHKHDSDFPRGAVDWLLDTHLNGALPDVVAYYEKPLIKFERILATAAALAPRGLLAWLRRMPRVVSQRLLVPARLEDELEGAGRFLFVPHHLSHAAAAFFPSPFEEAAILTIDGVGEWATATQGMGSGRTIALDRELRWPHSVGMLYSAFTAYLGFRINNGEYKVMGLAPYGEPRFAQAITSRLVDIKPDGSLRLDLRYFPFAGSSRAFSPALSEVLGGPPRPPESPIEQRHKDVARSIQVVVEDIVLKMARDLAARSGLRRLVMAGGVALNSVANGRLLSEGPFDEIWVQPAAGDAGGALGAALQAWHGVLGHPREPSPGDGMRGSLLGPAITPAAARSALEAAGLRFEPLDADQLHTRVAQLLDAGKVVAVARGPMEFGPRALGNRSILADPRRGDMRDRLNALVKKREGFRPFAPAVLAERLGDWFDLDRESPYMLFVVPVRAHARAKLPAVTHVDGSARVQTVDSDLNPGFAALIAAFEARTGCPVVVNTSFNVRGEPIVRTAEDAVRCFTSTGIDALVVADCLATRADGA